MKYDPFQEQAINCINQGRSVLVSAPTGSGKTVIAEHVIRDCLRRGERVIYTAPIKALSNQKYRDFQETFPDKVGILTGDVSINPHAPTLIMTTEIFRNKILDENSNLNLYSWIIFDEIHYLDDYERGSVWEESLIFLPQHMKVLGLSATVPNIDELAAWMTAIHQTPIEVIKEDKRPVPLHFLYQCQGQLFDNFNDLKRNGFKTEMGGQPSGRRLSRDVYLRPNRLAPLVEHLSEKDLLPCIYFAFSRRKTEQLAEEIMHFNFLTDAEQEQILERFDALCRQFDLIREPRAQSMRPFIAHGIAYHHAGMLPTLKEAVERLFTTRLIKVIFTTETFALGINMPARTVIFDELRKFYGRTFNTLRTRDFYQMAGRAGRRSIDTEGFVFSRINPHFIGANELHQVIYGEPEKVESRFNASYATILNLYQKYNEKLYDIYPSSFHFFQQQKNAQRKAVQLLREKVTLLKILSHIRKQQLTPKGLFASRVFGYELILSELHESGFLDRLSVEELGILILAVIYEPRKGARRPVLAKRVKTLESATNKIVQHIQRLERRAHITPLTKACAFHLTDSITGWMRNEPFDEILAKATADEGEIIRYLRMTIQVLRDMRDTHISENLQTKIHRLITLINRDIVDAEKQLRA